MTLQQLKNIIKIVECGSITKASQQLYITQPSLSSSLKELETELGIEIFNRTSSGISLTSDGSEFLSYARQVIEQAELLEQRYSSKPISKRLLSISTQHYAFAVNAFVRLVAEISTYEYEFTFRETRTSEIIEDVRNFRSDIGILYLSNFNMKIIKKLLSENHLIFTPLFTAKPHVFISSGHPLAVRSFVTPDDLQSYPFLAFEQGENNSFYFSEEINSTTTYYKTIKVSDRATLFNLLIGLNGYTISTGILSTDLNGENIVSVPLITDDKMQVGWIRNERNILSSLASKYIKILMDLILEYGYQLES